jgi:hypothetical protein
MAWPEQFMNTVNLLLVLVVRDVALRSTLVARLAMDGATVWTAQRFDEKLPASIRTPVLVTDTESVEAHPGGAAVLRDDARWRMVVVLTADAAPAIDDARLLHVECSEAAAALTQLLAGLQHEG